MSEGNVEAAGLQRVCKCKDKKCGHMWRTYDSCGSCEICTTFHS